MIKKTCLFLAAFILLFSVKIDAANEINNNWYPFTIEDPSSIKFIQESPILPAGSHGFLKTKNNKFYFDDGTPVNFWGTNLCFNANFPSKNQADVIAKRLSSFGFNAVRLHHLDFFSEPSGIFKQNPDRPNTLSLSEYQLEKLDYLIYTLKNNGIYININLLVSRKFTEFDGVKNADQILRGAKAFSFFDKKLIELQKKYAKQLLTHENKYTGLRYCDDPAIAFIEITNENSLITNWKANNLNNSNLIRRNKIPEYYDNQLNELFNNWLKVKYKTVSNFKKNWKLDSNINILNIPDWEIEKHSTANAELKKIKDLTIINVTNVTDTTWHVQYRSRGFKLYKSKHYLFKLKAHSNRDLKTAITAQEATSPYNNLGLSQELYLNNTSQEFEIPFTPDKDCDNAKLALIIGKHIGEISIEEISFAEVNGFFKIDNEDISKINEFKFPRPIYSFLNIYPKSLKENIKEFYIDLQKQFFDDMLSFLKNECGIKVPITGIGGVFDPEDFKSEENCDFLDTHSYFDHPAFPPNAGSKDNFSIKDTSIFDDNNLVFINKIKTLFLEAPNKPLTVTEWNHCFPNKYAYETPTFFATFAKNSKINAAFQFAFINGFNESLNLMKIDNYYDSYANPQQLILNKISSLIYLSNEPVNLETFGNYYEIRSKSLVGLVGKINGKSINNEAYKFDIKSDGAFFIISDKETKIEDSKQLTIVAISETKNSQAKWENNKYLWGTAPTILKTFNFQIENITSKDLIFVPINSPKKPIIQDTKSFNIDTSKYRTPIFEIKPNIN